MERYLGQNIIKGIKKLLNEANLKAKYIKVTDAIKLINDDNYIFIDIRTQIHSQSAKFPAKI